MARSTQGHGSPSRFSFKFFSSVLEQNYQQHVAPKLNWWTLFTMAHILVGWCVFGITYFRATPEMKALAPPVWTGMLAPITAATVAAVLLLCPTFFAQHRVSLGVVTACILAMAFRDCRAVLLWMEAINAAPGPKTWSQTLHAFFVENSFLVIGPIKMMGANLGQDLTFVIFTLALLLDLSCNRYICGLPFVGSKLVTMSPQLLKFTPPIIGWLRGVDEPHVGAMVVSRDITCHVALGFWQIAGWWILCHVAVAADILRRRAFLRTPAAQEYLGPEHHVAALRWPFRDAYKTLKVMLMSIGISYASVLWFLALPLLS